VSVAITGWLSGFEGAMELPVNIGRRLAETRPDTFLPQVAVSLNNLGMRSPTSGATKRLAASREAVNSRRRPVEARRYRRRRFPRSRVGRRRVDRGSGLKTGIRPPAQLIALVVDSQATAAPQLKGSSGLGGLLVKRLVPEFLGDRSAARLADIEPEIHGHLSVCNFHGLSTFEPT